MKRNLLLSTLVPVVFMSFSAFAAAQTSDQSTSQTGNSDTQQTDQSEEAWRKSKKKKTSKDPFDPFGIIRNTGSGQPLPPTRPIDNLPEESRRHLMRERAKAIADMEFGENGENKSEIKVYELSEAAKQDSELAAEEKEAWEVIVTDLKGSENSDAAKSSGPNKVAVSGQGGSSSPSVMRGGSAHSATEIMEMLKGMKSGNGTGSGNENGKVNDQTNNGGRGQSSTGNASVARGGSTQSASSILDGLKGGQSGNQSGSGQYSGPSPSRQTVGGQAQNGKAAHQGGSNAQSNGQATEGAYNGDPASTRAGSTQNASSILDSLKGGQSGTANDALNGQSPHDAAHQAESRQASTVSSSNQANDGSAQSASAFMSDKKGSIGKEQNAGSGIAAQNASESSPSLFSEQENQPACNASSASAYIRNSQGSQNSDTCQ